MATKIRLMRMGRKKRPFYRIVIADSRERRDGRFIESIGFYNPMPEQLECKIDEDRAMKWLGEGAVPTDTVRNLLSKAGILKKIADAQSAK